MNVQGNAWAGMRQNVNSMDFRQFTTTTITGHFT